MRTRRSSRFHRRARVAEPPFRSLLLAIASGAAAIVLGAGLFRISRILLETDRVLPAGLPRRPPADPARAPCSGCGAELDFAAGQLGQVCSYCGAETFRSRMAVETTLVEARSAQQSLTEIASFVAEVWRGGLRVMRWVSRLAAVVAALLIGAGFLAVYLEGPPPKSVQSPEHPVRPTHKGRHKASVPMRGPRP